MANLWLKKKSNLWDEIIQVHEMYLNKDTTDTISPNKINSISKIYVQGSLLFMHCEVILTSPVWLCPAKCSNTDKQLYSRFRVLSWLSGIVSVVLASVYVSAKCPPVDPNLDLSNTF